MNSFDPHLIYSRRHFLRASAAVAAMPALMLLPARAAPPPTSGTPDAAALLARIRPPIFPDRDFRVFDFGARPNADSLSAFRLAVRRCNAAGGGRVIVPRGVWELAGPLHLQSNVNLHLEDGAHLRFNTHDPARFLPAVLSRWEGTELFNYSPFIYAYQAHNVALTGAGTIDGNSHDTFVKWRPRQGDDQRTLRKMGADGTPVHERIFGAGHWLRPPLVQFFACTNVMIDGPRFIDAPFWVIHAVACSNFTLRRVHVDSPHLNNDGFDPESCSDVLVEDCVFRTGDDCIALKSGRDQDAWRIGRPTENVLIRRCEMHAPTAGSALALGSEMSGGVRNVIVESLRIGEAKTALNFKSNLDRGGLAESVLIRDLTVEETDFLLQVTTDYHGYRGGDFPPVFRGFRFDNIHCRVAGVPLSAVGVPAARLEDFMLRNITVDQAAKPAVVRHVRNFLTEAVTIGGQPFTAGPNVD